MTSSGPGPSSIPGLNPTPSTPNPLLPQLTLATSLTLYPLLFYLFSSPSPSAAQLSKSREFISFGYSSLSTLGTAYELWTHRRLWDSSTTIATASSAPSNNVTPPHGLSDRGVDTGVGRDAETQRALGLGIREGRKASEEGAVRRRDSDLPLITTRSVFANCITALEMGYLVVDIVFLVGIARAQGRERGAVRGKGEAARGLGGDGNVRGRGDGKWLVKEIDWRPLLWHHGVLAVVLGILQGYIRKGRERGVLVVLMLMLMNASTPISTIHWYLVNFLPARRTAIFAANAIYLATYATCRVYLLYWILQVFGKQMSVSAWQAFAGLRVPCKLGLTALGAMNGVWFGMMCRNFWRRYGRGFVS